MLLAIESYRAWRAYGIDGGLKAIKEAGFDGVDFSFYWDAAKELCGEDYRENAKKIREALDRYGLACNQAHAPFDFLVGMPQDDSCFAYLSIKRAIEMAGIIGIDHIVVHGVAVPEGAVSRASLDYNYAYFKSFEPLLQSCHVKLAVENLMASCTYPDIWSEMLTRLDSESYVGLVDVGHAWLRAYKPTFFIGFNCYPSFVKYIQTSKDNALRNWPDFIRRVKPGYLKGLHIQDTHGIERNMDEHLVPFLANIDFDDLIAALKEVGYEGDFTMEAPRFLDFYANQGLLEPALRFAEEIGRNLIKRF